MTHDFFQRPFEERGINVIVPPADQQAYIHQKIVTELENGIVKPDTKSAFLKIVQMMMSKDNIDGLVLGCTELPLLLHSNDVEVSVLDIAQIHIDALVDKMFAES